jgi:AraC-like DNA-binding protein
VGRIDLTKPAVIWVDQQVGTSTTEVPEQVIKSFQVHSVRTFEAVDPLIVDLGPACIFVDFDYPDRRRLASFAELKTRNPSLPIVMMTVQHSESLAVWAFRHGVLDYLVKPAQSNEIRDSIERILKIVELKEKQRSRSAKLFKPAIPHDIPTGSQSQSQRLAPAVYYVKQNYSQRIYSDAMARLCGMSPTHFSRSFRKAYGLTFQEFLLRYRVRQACRYMMSPTASITDIAYNVGFSDPSYFTRVFRRYLGISPSEYVAANDECAGPVEVEEDREEDLKSTSQIVRRLSGPFKP